MALDPKTPGVYIQEVSVFPPSVAPVATAIPAFIGYTEDSVADAKRITSMNEFVDTFGGPQPYLLFDGDDGSTVTSPTHFFKLYYSLQHFFLNGGRECWVVSAGQYTASPLAADIGTLWNEGALGKVALEDEPTLIVIPDADVLGEAGHYTVFKAALAQCNQLQDRFAIIDVFDKGNLTDSITALRNQIGTQYLKYGAVYYPDLVTSLSYPDSAVLVDNSATTTNTQLQNKTVATIVAEADTTAAVADQWIEVEKTIRDSVKDQQITLPPSGAIAGIYAAVDRDRGVWKAPANVSINGVLKPEITITNEDQDGLNVNPQGKSVNAIRAFTGRGILVWGARTLAGNDAEWRYVPVRRLFIFVEESIQKATEFVVFEPNDANTWLRVKTMIENFLINLWKDGALAGPTPDAAFFVKVGLGETMTSQDVLDGKLIVEVGMAAVRPAEFIILRFSHKLQEA